MKLGLSLCYYCLNHLKSLFLELELSSIVKGLQGNNGSKLVPEIYDLSTRRVGWE